MAEGTQKLQSTQVIAKIFGVSTRRVEQLKAEGIIKGEGKPTKYDLLPTIQAYIKYLSDKAKGKEKKEEDSKNESSRLDGDARIKQAKAEIQELKLKELKEKGLDFSAVKEKITEFRDNMETKFVLESLENLRKNGRLSRVTFTICNVLNIRPVMAADDGEIIKVDQVRCHNKALMRMIEHIEKDAKDVAYKILGITHCNNPERAEWVKTEILKRLPFKDCIIVNAAGVSTLYANDGGIIVSY